jgi:DNA primase, catalytic core
VDESKYISDFNKVKDGVDIVEVVEKFVSLSKDGNSYVGFSPFKNENTPSFKVNQNKKIFKDFSSGIGGDVIQFYSLMKKISRVDAMRELARMYNINISNSYNRDLYSLEHKILNDAVKFFSDKFKVSKVAQEYMINRGYNIKDLNEYSIGYAPDSWNELYEELKVKYDVKAIQSLGLISNDNLNSDRYYDNFRNRIIFPIFNTKNQIIALGGRYIGTGDSPKYINSMESKIFNKSNELYGIFDGGVSLKQDKYAILTEGYLDVLSSHLNGFKNTVASLGTAFTDGQAKLIKKYVNSILILYDNDDAGKMATIRAINILNKNGFSIRCLNLPNGFKDPDEYFRINNKDDFISLLDTSIEAFQYVFNIYSSDLDLEEVSSKLEIINRFKPYFKNINNRIILKDEIVKLSKNIKVDYDDLIREYKDIFASSKKEIRNDKTKTNFIANNKNNKRYMLEKVTLEFLLSSDLKFERYVDIISTFDFKNEIYNNLNLKLRGIGYNTDNINENLYLSEDEYQVLSDLVFNKKKDLDENSYVRLLQSWLKLYLEEIKEEINLFEDIEKMGALYKVSLLTNKLNVKDSIMDLEILHKDIIELRREYDGRKQ